MQYIAPAVTNAIATQISLQPKFGPSVQMSPGPMSKSVAPNVAQGNGHVLRPNYEESDFIRFFRFYGLQLELINKQLNGPCPFLDCRRVNHESPDHFFASPANGCWDCKYCGRSGNIYDFIRLFHTDAIATTTGQDYYDLASKRPGIPAWVFPIFGLAKNPLNGEWLLPAYSLKKGEISNLYAWKQQATENGPVMTVMSGPCLKQILFGLQYFRRDHSRPVRILEGHWDFMADYGLMYQLGLLESYDLVGTPGDKFPKLDVHLLGERVILHHGDNDPAGDRSMSNLLSLMGTNNVTPKQIYRMGFAVTEKKGLDVRDIIAENPIPQNAWSEISRRYYEIKPDIAKHANEAYNPNVKLVPCDNFNDVIDCAVNGGIYMPDCLRDTFSIITMIAATTGLGEKPLWCHIIGPSGSSKTTLLSLVSSSDPYCFYMSTWTGLVSGYYQHGLGDNSLLPKLLGKCVCIEDFTPILSETEQTQAKLFGELREAYGGKMVKSFKTPDGLKSFSDTKFNMLTCVTERIRKANNTDLGERFLQCDQDSYWLPDGTLIRDGIDRKIIVNTSIKNALEAIGSGKIDKFTKQRSVCWGFLDYVATRIREEPDWVHSKLAILAEDLATCSYYGALAQWTAYARAFIDRDREKQARYEQRAEFGTRLSNQLIKSAIAASLIFDEEPNSDRVKGVVRKLALDTGYGPMQEFMLMIAKSSLGLTVSQMERLAGVSQSTVFNRLRDPIDLAICQSRETQVRTQGNQAHVYSLTPELQSIANELGFGPKHQIP